MLLGVEAVIHFFNKIKSSFLPLVNEEKIDTNLAGADSGMGRKVIVLQDGNTRKLNDSNSKLVILYEFIDFVLNSN